MGFKSSTYTIPKQGRKNLLLEAIGPDRVHLIPEGVRTIISKET